MVDDDRGLLRLIGKALQREGFSTATAASGAEAIAWLGKHHADLTLLDLKLPDLEGKEVIAHLRETPFVVITGQGDERIAVEMMKRGALDYLIKDVHFVELVPTVVHRVFGRIEDQKRLQVAERQARLAQTLVEQGSSGAMILQAHLENPMIAYANPALATLVGCAVDHLVGSPFRVLDAFAHGWEPIARALAAQRAFSGILRLRRRNAEQRSARCRMTPICDHGGEQTHWAVVIDDVTQQQRLERELLDISDREQNRIGQDLHDNLGQKLTALELFTQALVTDLRKDAPELVASAAEISRQLQAVIRDARTMAHVLSPVSLDKYGLQNALRELARATTVLTGVRCEFTCETETQAHDLAVATQLYRIAQEGTNNAVKHAGATRIHVSLKENGDCFDLTIEDNGQGFSASASKQDGMGLGLMQHRASLIGASLVIQSEPGKGTQLCCRAPARL